MSRNPSGTFKKVPHKMLFWKTRSNQKLASYPAVTLNEFHWRFYAYFRCKQKIKLIFRWSWLKVLKEYPE